jgi:hypothetical protein
VRDCRFALYEGAIRDTIERFEATDSPVVTDGEQREYHNFLAYCVHMGFRTRSRMVSKSVIGRSYPPYVAAHARPLSLFALRRFVPGCGHALSAPAGQGGRDIAIGLESDVPSRRHSRLSVMLLRNSHPDATRFSAALSMIEIFNLVNHASRQSGNCPILTALLIEVAAGTLDCSVVGLSPRPEQV